MKLLADSHILLWAASSPGRLSETAKALLIDPENELYFSAANIWEIAIKSALGRADFQTDAIRLQQGLLANGYHELPILSAHGLAAAALPPIHKDPFDRILIAQAASEQMLLLTSDLTVAKYQGPVRLV
jgi:PIN domain nuclease of toxin-antitoxin system